MQELKILEKLRYNRNVVQFYGSYIEQGDVMLVFEYMEVNPFVDLFVGVCVPICISLHVLHSII